MKILYVGINDFSFHCLRELIGMRADICAVLTKRKSSFNSDYKDLSVIARKYRIPVHYINDINSKQSERIIRKHKPDVIFCFGWSQLLEKTILRSAPLGTIGVHPANLPNNRGRHPIIWSLCLGLKRSALTFFRMDECADMGDIVSQEKFSIHDKDDAARVYKKIKKLASKQIREFLPLLKNGKLRYRKQKKA